MAFAPNGHFRLPHVLPSTCILAIDINAGFVSSPTKDTIKDVLDSRLPLRRNISRLGSIRCPWLEEAHRRPEQTTELGHRSAISGQSVVFSITHLVQSIIYQAMQLADLLFVLVDSLWRAALQRLRRAKEQGEWYTLASFSCSSWIVSKHIHASYRTVVDAIAVIYGFELILMVHNHRLLQDSSQLA